MNITNFNVIAIGRNIMCRIQSSCWWRSRRAVLRKTRLVASCARRSTAICLIASRSRREEQQCYATALIGITLFLLGLRHRQGEKPNNTSFSSSSSSLLLLLLLLSAVPLRGSSRDPRFASCTDLHFLPQIYFLFFLSSSLFWIEPLDAASAAPAAAALGKQYARSAFPPGSFFSTNDVAEAPSPAAELRISISAPFISPRALFLSFHSCLLAACARRQTRVSEVNRGLDHITSVSPPLPLLLFLPPSFLPPSLAWLGRPSSSSATARARTHSLLLFLASRAPWRQKKTPLRRCRRCSPLTRRK